MRLMLRYTSVILFIAGSQSNTQAQSPKPNAPIANDYVAVWTSPAPTEETGGPVSMIQLP